MYTQCEAIVPYYDGCGQNCTYVILKDGSRMDHKMPIKSFIRKMFYELHIDMDARTKWGSGVLRHDFGNPILISDQLVLVPVRLRKPVGAKDGCFGYVSLRAIKEVGDYNLSLACGQRVSTLSKTGYVTGKMRDGEHLAYAYRAFCEV